jgi:hypothetical protein
VPPHGATGRVTESLNGINPAVDIFPRRKAAIVATARVCVRISAQDSFPASSFRCRKDFHRIAKSRCQAHAGIGACCRHQCKTLAQHGNFCSENPRQTARFAFLQRCRVKPDSCSQRSFVGLCRCLLTAATSLRRCFGRHIGTATRKCHQRDKQQKGGTLRYRPRVYDSVCGVVSVRRRAWPRGPTGAKLSGTRYSCAARPCRRRA